MKVYAKSKTNSPLVIQYVKMSSPKALKYLELDPYYIENFKDYEEPFTGEVAIDVINNRLAGYIYVGSEGSSNEGFIETLEVNEDYQHRGIGTKLLTDAIRDLSAIDLLVDKDNEKAISLYLKTGFEIVPWEDENQFWMKLQDNKQ